MDTGVLKVMGKAKAGLAACKGDELNMIIALCSQHTRFLYSAHELRQMGHTRFIFSAHELRQMG